MAAARALSARRRAHLAVFGATPLTAGPSAFWVWAVFDDMISGAALNAVRVAGTLHARGPGWSDG